MGVNVLLVHRDSQRTAHVGQRWKIPAQLVEEILYRGAIGQREGGFTAAQLFANRCKETKVHLHDSHCATARRRAYGSRKGWCMTSSAALATPNGTNS